MIHTALSKMLNIEFPIIMAPMFLVTNADMMIEASKVGITGAIPALNFRTTEKLKEELLKIKKNTRCFGVNLIVNKSNIYLKDQLKICQELEVDFIITSLGSPQMVIEAFKGTNTKIFCDVVDLKFALKVEQLGAHAIIAVNSSAGGHAGNIPASILIPMLKKHCKIPIISAGGVATGAGMLSMLALGADGLSIGSPFICSTESPVSSEYKKAIIEYGAKDIVMTSKISGTPCSVINTPYLQKIGTQQNIVERILNKNKKLKKYIKMMTFHRGSKLLEKAAFGATYKTVWCAGPSIEFIEEEKPVKDIVNNIVNEYIVAINNIQI